MSDVPKLTDHAGMGGIRALTGFDYQVWDCLVRLPAWLKNPGFEALLFEGHEDLEARFFTPHAPTFRLLERYQAKSGSLTLGDVKDIFCRFLAFEKSHPHTTRVHSLVTQQLPPNLRWLANDGARIRHARPFYAPFSGMMAATDHQFEQQLVKTFGQEMGRFAATSIEVVERAMPDRDSAITAFSVALERSFPGLELSVKKTTTVFEALGTLVRGSVAKPLGRRTLLETFKDAAVSLEPTEHFPLHVRSDRNGTVEDALEIDASPFAGGETPFPEPARWAEHLLTPLDATANWLKGQGVTRVSLQGSFRLAPAFALGWTFRSARGFDIHIPTRSGIWTTEDRADMSGDAWSVTSPQKLKNRRLRVSVGILRRPADELVSAGMDRRNILDVFLPSAVDSSKAAQAGVEYVKTAVNQAISRLHPECIDFFYAGPAAFAVALGHRWNPMPPTFLHEFEPTTRGYVSMTQIGSGPPSTSRPTSRSTRVARGATRR